MDIKLANIKKVQNNGPCRILIYGSPGSGKTTLAAEFPHPIFISLENGIPADLEVMSFGLLQKLSEVQQALQVLTDEEHSYKTLVIDSLTILQQLINERVCSEHDQKARDFSRGKAFEREYWDKLLRAMNILRSKKKMNIVLIGHSQIERVDDPMVGPYYRHSLDIHKHITNKVELEMDAVLFLTPCMYNAGVATDNSIDFRMIYTTEIPSHIAKNRYGFPAKMKYRKGEGFKALSAYLPHDAQYESQETANTGEEKS